MANVFTKELDVTNHPKRNTVDMSFQNNLTMNFGGLYPVLAQEVIPGDSARINLTFGLRFMPMVFPIQTRMRAYLHFFYVRNRNLWEDWQNFIGATDYATDNQLGGMYSLPYCVAPSITVPRTGSLADYMGIPTTLVGRFGSEDELVRRFQASYGVSSSSVEGSLNIYFPFSKLPAGSNFDLYDNVNFNGRLISSIVDDSIFEDFSSVGLGAPTRYNGVNGSMLWTVVNDFTLSNPVYTESGGVSAINLKLNLIRATSSYSGNGLIILGVNRDGVVVSTTSLPASNFGVSREVSFTLISSLASEVYRFVILFNHTSYTNQNMMVMDASMNVSEGLAVNLIEYDTSGLSYVDRLTTSSSPYVRQASELGTKVPISALPFRAYESIYNSFYRDPRNNPYIISGMPEYNQWIPTKAGGADNQDYQLRYRNWEADFLTTALPSPQQGRAPLVGMTSYGTLTFMDEEGKVFKADLEYSEDGQGLKGINVQSSDEPVGSITRLVDMATQGFTIGDLRGVNALQRWLEINQRRGFRYKDQVKSHFDVDIRFDELDMPEFIGGVSEDVRVNQISQTISQGDTGTWQDALGSYAGQASCVGSSKSAITHYCDEHGYIIGILCVVPVPNYSQLMPKHFLKRTPLDYYFPEFGKLGPQPIHYDEVCPIQMYNSDAGAGGLKDVFGYQRAWYDYLSRVDEVHGLFRENLRNFLMNRIFEQRPQLSEDFLTVQPEQVNQVFSVTEVSDKILGQVYFDFKMKRPIPEYGIPALE